MTLRDEYFAAIDRAEEETPCDLPCCIPGHPDHDKANLINSCKKGIAGQKAADQFKILHGLGPGLPSPDL